MPRAALQYILRLFLLSVVFLVSCIHSEQHPEVDQRHLLIRAQTDNKATVGYIPGACVVADEPKEIWIEKGHKHDVQVITSERVGRISMTIDNSHVASVEPDAGNSAILQGRGLGLTNLHINASAEDHHDERDIAVRGLSPRVTVVAWIDGDAIDLNAIAPHASRSLRSMLASPAQCLGLVMAWLSSPPSIRPLQISTADDALYAKAFLVKGAANPRPPRFLPEDFEVSGSYKLMNTFQATADADGSFDVALINRGVYIGKTPDPCGLLPSEHYPVFTLDGEEHPTNNKTFVVGNGIVQMNQARINQKAQTVERNLTDRTRPVGAVTPWIWSGIRIEKDGEFSVCLQRFPSFAIYIDSQLVEERKQANLVDFMHLDENSQIQPVSCN